MKLQKNFEKKMTKIDINLKNLSSSPKKEIFRVASPNKVRINYDYINKGSSRSPLRNNYNHNVLKIQTNTLLANLKNNKNLTNKSQEKNSFEVKKTKFMLPTISQKTINVTNGHISKGIRSNKDTVKFVNNIRTSRSIDKRSDSLGKSKTTNDTIFYQNNYSPRNSSPIKLQHHNRILLQSPTNSKREIHKNNSELKVNTSIKDKHYYYIIVPGNNSNLVKNCMTHRTNWRECPSSATSLFHFKWQQSSIGVDFNNFNRVNSIKQSFNHFEGHPNISNKLNLFVNMFKYCEVSFPLKKTNGLDVFKFLPFTVIIHYESPNYLVQLENFSKLFNNIKEFVGYNTIDSKKSSRSEKKYANMFNLNNSDKLGSKTNIYINPSHYDGKNLWLIKAPDMNRGRCIKLVNNISSISKTIKKFYDGIYKDFKKSEEEENKYTQTNFKKIKTKEEDVKKNSKQEVNPNNGKKYRTNLMLLQKYIEKPFLYYGRKFDIRIWVLITHELDLEGHLKTASLPYNNNNIDSFVHLTNYSVQKYNDNFSKFEYGNEVSFRDFQNFLNTTFPDKRIDVRNNIYNKILELIKLSFKSVKDKLKEGRKYTFEIFGYDFILDCNLDIYLLEINTNPGLEESSPLISQLVPRMIDDALRLTIDTIFETKYSCLINGKYFSPYHVDGYNESENMWELVSKNNENDNTLKIKRL